MIRYRGKRAAQHYEARRRDGKLFVAVKDIPNCYLVAVESYKHLGGTINIRGCDLADARHKRDCAMTAYCPISMRVFGSPRISDFLKLHFLESLVMSRLTFNAHIIVPTARYIAILNQPYMRVLRRISGAVNVDGTAGSDLSVRKSTSQPSLDCILQRLRLRYLYRLLSRRPPTLMALLHFTSEGKQLAWTSLVINDMCSLREYLGGEYGLPHPRVDSNAWLQFIIADESRWSREVSRLFYTWYTCDTIAPRSIEGPIVNQHSCELCGDYNA